MTARVRQWRSLKARVGTPRRGLGWAVARGVALAGLVVLAVLCGRAGVAWAEPFCTDSWVGASEGAWETGSNWSSGSAPKSSDVACIGSGKTAVVSERYATAGVVGRVPGVL